MDAPEPVTTGALMRLMQELTARNWELFLVVLALFLLWRLGARVVGERPLQDHFPRISAAVDVLLLPIAYVVGGALIRKANRTFGTAELDSLIVWGTAILAYGALGWAIARLLVVMLRLRAQDKGKRIPGLITGLIYGTLIVVALGVFMHGQGYSFAGVWVSTGVAAAVLGLALQKTLGDLFSGIALNLERPFEIGDWLELDNGTLGIVVDMNWRATRLRAWDNTTLIVPNSTLASQSIKNLHGESHLYAPWYFIKIPADVDPRYATELLLEAALRCESVLKMPAPVVRLADATGLPYSYMVWVHLKNYPAMFRAREELFREIHTSLVQSGIEVAPEVQELRTRRANISTAEPPTLELALKAMELAREFNNEELAVVAANSEYRHFKAGQVLVAEGALSDAFYVIAGGLVESAVLLPDGTRKELENFGPGSYFGLTAMLTSEPSIEEFRAKSDVTLIRVDLDCVRKVVEGRPALKDALVQVIKTRLDTIEAARSQSRRPARRLTLRDISLGIERRLRRQGRG